MEKESDTEKHLNYFTNKLLEYALSNCQPNRLTAAFINERARNATDIYFSVLRNKKSSAYAYDKAMQLLYLGLKQQ